VCGIDSLVEGKGQAAGLGEHYYENSAFTKAED
jgi:hypothetical protein